MEGFATKYTVDQNGDSYYAVFENRNFSEGASRYAFKGILLGTGPRNNTECVVKMFKQDYLLLIPDLQLFDETKKCFEASCVLRKWATEWNNVVAPFLASSNIGEPTKIDCVIPLVTEISHGNPLQRHVTIEEYLQGNYQKFNSNGGFEDRQLSNILSAFSHWTWEKSCRQIMICDLQGRYFKFLIYNMTRLISSTNTKNKSY